MQIAFLDSITSELPMPARPKDAANAWDKWNALADGAGKEYKAITRHVKGHALLEAIFGNSPFLTHIILKHPDWFVKICETRPEKAFADLCRGVKNAAPTNTDQLMQILRIAKREASLIAAVADISSAWDVQEVTKNLSLFAEIACMKAAEWLLAEAGRKGDLELPYPDDATRDSGWIILAMGKLGARELNYSSDIDLILLFDKDSIHYKGEQTLQHLMNRMTQELVRILQERTSDGYVFRTDIRLRPDPASTPACMSVNAAMTYYETVGQNWERAALIKARPIAADIHAGYEFLKRLTPFIWRKYLDFVAIDDIQSIKRQMDAYHQSEFKVEGHNIKIGIGGIREIEFYAQIHQLIWGGRMPQLRSLVTTETLPQLAKEGLIAPDVATIFVQSYWYLRKVEHRLQMVNDHQTHSIPENEEDVERIALFMGYKNSEAFRADLIRICGYVHDIYIHSFKGQGKLGTEGKLVFTGVDADPGTVENLSKMGFTNPLTVCEVIAGWHRGSRRATRNKRARELITEVTPTMLKAFAATASPDQAFIRFDEFVGKLPAGVQIFSLFYNNPSLLELIATIMGSAPAMADTLARYPNLLDSVLTGAFYDPLPDRTLLLMEFSNFIFNARDYEDELSLLRQFKNEKHFQAGIQLLTGKITHIEAGEFLSLLADIILLRTLKITAHEFAKSHGMLGDDSLAVVALGKLGAEELTFGSDLDLVFIYQLDESSAAASDGEKSLSANVYFGRLCQRFIGALTSLAREGRLYEVDMRLRPSGNQGPIAVSTDAFNKYFSESAWTFERMALTKARVISGTASLKTSLHEDIKKHLARTADEATLKKDIKVLRAKVEEEFGGKNAWDLKYARGGLMELDFTAQYLVLRHAREKPAILRSSTLHIFESAKLLELMDVSTINILLAAHHFLSQLFYILRLCSDGTLNPETAPSGLKRLLVQLTGSDNFGQLQARLQETEASVAAIFNKLFA